MSKVSIILPVYNGEKYLAEAIESILDQTFQDFELLIINDCSPDNSEIVISKFTDKRIKYVKSEVNRGLAETLNNGIRLAKGAYIARMDQDDISDARRLELQVEALDGDKELGLCGTAIRLFGGTNPHVVKNPESHESIFTNLLFYNCMAHPSVMFRKDLFIQNKLLYDKSYDWAEDFELWCRAKYLVKCLNINFPLLNYRINETSMTASSESRVHRTIARINNRNLEDLGLHVSEDQLILHMKIGHFMIDSKNVLEVHSVEDHLIAIIKQNEQIRIYSDHILKSVISKFWYSILIDMDKQPRKYFLNGRLSQILGIKFRILKGIIKEQYLSKLLRLVQIKG